MEILRYHSIVFSLLVQLDVKSKTSHNHRILFSGDLGQPDQPILRHYEYPQGADTLIIESTYADRLHPSAADVEGRLKGFIDDIIQQKSKLLIPAFSVGRTQQILYFLNRLLAAKRIYPVPVYIDSPLSQKATEIYRSHKNCYNDQALKLINSGIDPLTFPNLKFVGSAQDSMALNSLRGPMVIIAASGMCEGGRVVHHLKEVVCDSRNIILIVGFQAENTLGRRIVELRDPIKILGEELPLRARVHTINALSAHADRNGLEDWLDGVRGSVKRAFAVHGEKDRTDAMAEILASRGIRETAAPSPGQAFKFD